MEKRALAMHHFTQGHRNLPEAMVLYSEEDRRCARRTGHEWKLVISVSSLEAMRSSSLKTARQIICEKALPQYQVQRASRTL
uniref:Uncharacterized protein n=1 Tax=Acrobeloides nanus TaxID=290746 RepID=A0A914DQB9_9BILA